MWKYGPSSAFLSKLTRENVCAPTVVTKLRPLFSNSTSFSSAPRIEEHNPEGVPTTPKSLKISKAAPSTLKYKRGLFLSRVNVDNFIERKLQESNIADISIFLTRSASRSEETSSVTFLLGYHGLISKRLEILSESQWSFWQIAATLSSLKCMRETEDGVQRIISSMTKVIDNSLARDEIVAADDIALIMKGLTGIAGREEGSRKLLAKVSQAIIQCKDEFTSAEVVVCLRALQGKNSEFPEVLSLLYVLTERLNALKIGSVSSISLSHIMFSTYRMSSDSTEVQGLLKVVNNHIRLSSEGIDAESMGNIIYGMQKMSSDNSEVTSLIATILSKSKRGPKDFMPQTSSNAFTGMAGFNSEKSEVRQLLLHLIPNVEGSLKCYHPRGLADTFLGMQNMSSDCTEVRAVLQALLRHVKNGTGSMDAQSVGNAFFGLQNMKDDCEEVKDLLIGFIPIIRNSSGILSVVHIERALFGLKKMNQNSVEVRELIQTLLVKVKSTEKIIDLDIVIEDSAQVKLLLQALQHSA